MKETHSMKVINLLKDTKDWIYFRIVKTDIYLGKNIFSSVYCLFIKTNR